MKTTLVTIALGAGFLFSSGAFADPPAGATAECTDGTYYSGASHQGACKGHQGVKTWLDSKGGSSTSSSSSSSGGASTGKSTSSTSSGAAAASTSTSSGTPPAGAIAKCKDGTYYSGTSHQGACKGHQGVGEWLDKGSSSGSTTTTSKVTSTPAAAPAPAPTAKPPAPTPATPATTHAAPTSSSQIQQKAGGGPGLVWVNSDSKVYHCQSDQWYGKTKEGSYMSEAAAKAAGNRAAGGKECGK
jgi:Protein of unknown function (DUF3761)